jgi:hypothetical protein
MKEPTYLFLTSSTLKEKQRKEIFRLYILKNRISNLLVFDKKGKYRNQEKKFNVANSTANISNQIDASDGLIEGKKFKHSNQIALPSRSNLRALSMSSNLQGETILMAYPRIFQQVETERSGIHWNHLHCPNAPLIQCYCVSLSSSNDGQCSSNVRT